MTDHKIIEGQDIILSGEGIAFVNNVLINWDKGYDKGYL